MTINYIAWRFATALDVLIDVLLDLQCDGADASTTITDSSTYARTVTVAGNAQLDTGVSPMTGLSSLLLDGTGDYVSVADAANLEPGSSNFVLCAKIRPSNVNAGNYNIFVKRADSSTYSPFLLRREGNVLSLKHSTTGASWDAEGTGGTLVANVWHEVVLARIGSTLKVYLNGASTITQAISGSLYDNAGPLVIGGDTNANYWTGHIDDVYYAKNMASADAYLT